MANEFEFIERDTSELVDEENIDQYYIDDSSIDPTQVSYTDPNTGQELSYEDIIGESETSPIPTQQTRYVDEQGNEIADYNPNDYEVVTQDETAPVRYVDEAGNEITDFSPDRYDVVPEVGFWDRTVNSFASRMNDLNEGLYGTARLGADAIGAEGASRYFNDQADLAKITSQMYRDDNFGQETALSNAAAMAPEALYSVGVSALSLPAGITYGVLKQGSETLGRDYNENENLGVASKRAAVDSLADLPLNFLPGMKGSGVGGYIKNSATTFGSMSGLNAVSEFYKDYSQQSDIEKKETVDLSKSVQSAIDVVKNTSGETAILSAILPLAARTMPQRKSASSQATDIDLSKMDAESERIQSAPPEAPVAKPLIEAEVPVIQELDAPAIPLEGDINIARPQEIGPVKPDLSAAIPQEVVTSQKKFNLPDPIQVQGLELGVRNLQEVRPKIAGHTKLDIETTAADFIRGNMFDVNEAINMGDKTNQYRNVLERKLSQSKSRAEIDNLRTELDRLDYISLDPDLLGRLKAAEKPTADIFKAREVMHKEGLIPDLARDEASRMELDKTRLSAWNDESGALNFEPVVDVFKKAKDSIVSLKRNNISQLQLAQELAKKYNQEAPKVRQSPVGEDYGSGKIAGMKVPLLDRAVAFERDKISRPKSLAQKFPEYKKGYDLAEAEIDRSNFVAYDLLETAMPALQTTNRGRLNKILNHVFEQSLDAHKKGKSYVVTPETIKAAGGDDADVQGYFAIRQANDKAFDYFRDGMKIRAEDEAKIALDRKLRTIKDSKDTKDVQDALIAKAIEGSGKSLSTKKELLDLYFEEKKLTNYLPAMREGEFFVKGDDPKTKEPVYYLAKDQTQQAKIIDNLVKERGFVLKDLEQGKVPKPVYNHEQGLDPATRLELSKLLEEVSIGDSGDTITVPNASAVTEGKKLSGFKGHLLDRKGVEGYNTDFIAANVKYLEKLANSVAKLENGGKKKQVINDMTLKKQGFLKQNLEALYKDLDTPSEGLNALMTLSSHYHLGFLRPSAGFVDYLGSVTSTIPELSRYAKNSPGEFAKAVNMAVDFKKNREAFAKKNPELAKDLDYHIRIGSLGSTQVAGLTGDVGNLNPVMAAKDKSFMSSAKDVSMFFKKFADEQNKMFAFVAGYNNAPKGVSKARFARDFVDKTQAIYGGLNRPKIGRGYGRPFYQMKEFTQNYMSNVGEAYGDLITDQIQLITKKRNGKDLTPEQVKELKGIVAGDYRRAIAYPTTLAATGGIRAIPGIATIAAAISYASDGEIDLVDEIREGLPEGKMGDVMLAGSIGVLPQTVGLEGFSISGQLNPGSMGPDLNKSAPEQIVQNLGGAAGGMLINSIGTGLKAYKATGDLGFALREASPPGIKNPLRGIDIYKTGTVKNINRQDVLQNAKPEEALYQALGFPPLRVVESQELEGKKYKIVDEGKAETNKMYIKLANFYREGKEDQAQKMIEDLAEKGIPVDVNSIIKAMFKAESPEYRLMSNVPDRLIEKVQAAEDLYGPD